MEIQFKAKPERHEYWYNIISCWKTRIRLDSFTDGLCENDKADFSMEFETILVIDTNGLTEIEFSRLIKLHKNRCLIIIDSECKWAGVIIREYSDLMVVDYVNHDFTEFDLEQIVQKSIQYVKKNFENKKQFVTIWNNGQKILINANNIYRLEAFGSYTRVFSSNREFLVTRNLKNVLKNLPDFFVRIHRSFAIHLDYIESIYGNQVYLRNGESLQVSRSGKKNLSIHF